MKSKETIFATGCPTVDVCAQLPNKDLQSIFKGHEGVYAPKFVLQDNYIIVAFHPVTTEYETNKEHFDILLKTINDLDIQTIWLHPNIDAGNDVLKREIINFKANDKKGLVHFFKHFAIEDYLLLLKNTKCIIGNSSVGIRESSFFGTPSVTIGSRQRTRMRGENAIASNIEEHELREKILNQIKHGHYTPSSLYGNGNAGKSIADILTDSPITFDKQMTY